MFRLTQSSARNGKVITNYEYGYVGNPVNNQNYQKAETIFEADPTGFSSLTTRTTWQYFDGLGRPIQTVEQNYSESGYDVVKAIEYDDQGRQSKAYEPFESANSSGAFVGTIPSPYDTLFTLTEYHPSPLNRIWKVTPPEWHATVTTYANNADQVSVPGGSTYGAGELSTTVVEDPNGNKTITYVDKKGRNILTERTNNDGSQSTETYYEYDDKDRLTLVTPPGADAGAPELLYRYTYDAADNILTKKIPGQGLMQYLYDERDLMTFMQDGNLATQSRWVHTRYDEYGRATRTGLVDNAPSDGNEPAAFEEELTRTFYDKYGLSNAPDIYYGKVRRTETRLLGANDWLVNELFYDSFGRTFQSKGNHHLNLGNAESEVVTYAYDFADNIVRQTRQHEYGGSTMTILQEMHYDHAGRITENYHRIDDGPKVLLSELHYTAKDEIREKNLGKAGSSFLQSLVPPSIPPKGGSCTELLPLWGRSGGGRQHLQHHPQRTVLRRLLPAGGTDRQPIVQLLEYRRTDQSAPGSIGDRPGHFPGLWFPL